MNPRVIITFILFILFSFILASNNFNLRDTNDEADFNQPQNAYVALPSGNNLESGSKQNRDIKSFLSQIGREKRHHSRHHSHRIPLNENQYGANTQYNLYPDLPSTA